MSPYTPSSFTIYPKVSFICIQCGQVLCDICRHVAIKTITWSTLALSLCSKAVLKELQRENSFPLLSHLFFTQGHGITVSSTVKGGNMNHLDYGTVVHGATTRCASRLQRYFGPFRELRRGGPPGNLCEWEDSDPRWSWMEKHYILPGVSRVGGRHRCRIDPAIKHWTAGNWCQVAQTETVICWSFERNTENVWGNDQI